MARLRGPIDFGETLGRIRTHTVLNAAVSPPSLPQLSIRSLAMFPDAWSPRSSGPGSLVSEGEGTTILRSDHLRVFL